MGGNSDLSVLLIENGISLFKIKWYCTHSHVVWLLDPIYICLTLCEHGSPWIVEVCGNLLIFEYHIFVYLYLLGHANVHLLS